MASTSAFTHSRIPGGILRHPTASSQFFADRPNRISPFVTDEDEEENNASITRPVVHFPADSPVTSIQLVSYWIDAVDTPPSPSTEPDHACGTLSVPHLSSNPIGANTTLSSEQEADTDVAMSNASGDSPSPCVSSPPPSTTDQTGVVDSTPTFTLVYSATLAAIQQHQAEVEQRRQANETAAAAAAAATADNHLSCPYDCERCNNSAEQLQYDKQQHDSSAAADILDEIARELRARATTTRKRKREWMTGCADDLANGEVEITTPGPPLLKKARYVGTGGPGAFGAPSATEGGRSGRSGGDGSKAIVWRWMGW
ncbi:hypothetical protein SLS58_002966 [Diplodia intermedia]|uniref:Uncharacterized protein n=1 Tax=Diplodia intermedia TaxID=856260 RepID=A0ABR3TXC5_9PEZI